MSEERKENIQTGNPLGEASVCFFNGEVCCSKYYRNACQCLI